MLRRAARIHMIPRDVMFSSLPRLYNEALGMLGGILPPSLASLRVGLLTFYPMERWLWSMAMLFHFRILIASLYESIGFAKTTEIKKFEYFSNEKKQPKCRTRASAGNG